MNHFSNMLKNKKDGDEEMLKVTDSTIEYKIYPMTLDLVYQFKNPKKNRIGNCKFDNHSKGLVITSPNKKTLMGYIVVKNYKLVSIEVLPDYKDQGFLEKLISLAIDKFGLNEISVPKDRKRLIRIFKELGFEKVADLNDKLTMKLHGLITRKNNYLNMIVKRQTVENFKNEEEFAYYFYLNTSSEMQQVGKVVLIPSKKFIVEP